MKPGIIMGNIITVAGGFILGSRGGIHWLTFLATAIGLTFVIGSACAFNNYIDRDTDKKMARTKNRALARGLISGRNALVFATVLGLLGFATLLLYTNLLTAAVAFAGFSIYVAFYSVWKYRSIHGTIIGSLAGATPPVIGYCAASGSFDLCAFLLFAILVLWQMPHFFAIAMYRFHDYAAGGIPVLPVKKGMQRTKTQMLLYIIAFLGAASALTFFGFTGYAYLIVALALGITWLILGIAGFKSANDARWGRKMFIFSLVTITIFSIMISVDAVSKPVKVASVGSVESSNLGSKAT